MKRSLLLLARVLLIGWLVVLLAAASWAPAAAGSEQQWRSPLRPMTVTRRFEPPPTPYAAGHRGVDLAGSIGETVQAAANGTVSFAGRVAGKPVVVVSHGDLRTTYEPVVATVRRGAAVGVGDPIGTLQAGHVGCPAQACLHWGLLRGDTYLDPLRMLSAPAIRLLPVNGSPVSGPEAPPRDSLVGFSRAPGQAGAAARLAAAVQQRDTGNADAWVVSPVTWSLAAVAASGVWLSRRRG